MPLNVALLTIVSLYLVAVLFYLLRVLIGKAWLSAVGLRIVIFAALLQVAVLALHGSGSNRWFLPGYSFYFQGTATLLAVIFIVLCFTKKFYSGGLLFVPMTELLCIFSLTHRLPSQASLSPAARTLLGVHITGIFLSLSLFCVALVTAIMFLLGERQIKHKQFEGIIARFPPLTVLENIHTRSLLVGFVLFTVVIFSGSIFAHLTTGHFFVSDSLKQWLSLLCWIFFALVLLLRIKRIGRGHQGIVLSLLGFAGMLLLFLVGLS